MKTYKIAIDTKGADKGVAMIVKGAVRALSKYNELSVVLVGDSDVIRGECEKLSAPMERIEILEAPGEITNYDSPAVALFEKTDSYLGTLCIKEDRRRKLESVSYFSHKLHTLTVVFVSSVGKVQAGDVHSCF